MGSERLATPIEVAQILVDGLKEGFRLNVPRHEIAEVFARNLVNMLRLRDAANGHASEHAPRLAEALRTLLAEITTLNEPPEGSELAHLVEAARAELAEWKLGAP